MKRMSVGHALAGIAQGVINIDEGITTVEPDSRVHRAMADLLYYLETESGRNELCSFIRRIGIRQRLDETEAALSRETKNQR